MLKALLNSLKIDNILDFSFSNTSYICVNNLILPTFNSDTSKQDY